MHMHVARIGLFLFVFPTNEVIMLHILSCAGEPGVQEEALSLSLERLGSGRVVDLVAGLGYCVDSRKTRQLRHTLAESAMSGEKLLLGTVKQMRKAGRKPVVLFSVDNKDFRCPGTVDGSSVHFITVQAYVVDETDDGGETTPVRIACPARVVSKLSRRAPKSVEMDPIPFASIKKTPSGLDTPCATGSTSTGGEEHATARKRGFAWTAASDYMQEEGGIDFKDFEAGVGEQGSGVRDLIFELPPIDFPPRSSDGLDAVITAILSYLETLEQDSCALFCDGVEYADLATKIHGDDALNKKIFLALGGFHLSQAVMGAIGTVFKSAGLESIVVESGMLGESTSAQAFSCGHWDRAFRLHSLLFEVLCGDLYASYFDSLPDSRDGAQWKSRLTDLRKKLSSTRSDVVAQALSGNDMQRFHNNFSAFIKKNSAQSGTFQFHSRYLDAVSDLLHFFRVSRDYKGHGLDSYIAAMEAFQPILAAADRYET